MKVRFAIYRVLTLVGVSVSLVACGIQTVKQEAMFQTQLEQQQQAKALLEALQLQVNSLSELQLGAQSQLVLALEKLDQLELKMSNAQPVSGNTMIAEVVAEPVAVEPLVKMDKNILGRVEWLWHSQAQRFFAAQLDSAQPLSVLYADELKRFERDGKKWLRYTISRNEWSTQIEAPIVRQEKLRDTYPVQTIKGPVVRHPVRIANFGDELELIVVPRKKNYPQIVLGRNFLTDVALVDVALKYTVKRDDGLLAIEAEREKMYLLEQGEASAFVSDSSKSNLSAEKDEVRSLTHKAASK